VSASSLTSEEFIAQFVRNNQPVIVTHALDEWTTKLQQAQSDTSTATAPPAEWNIPALSRLLGGTVVHNVFVSSAAHRRRFKFFKRLKEGAAQSDPPESPTQTAAQAAASEGSVVASASQPSSAPAADASTGRAPEVGLSRRSMPFDEFVQLSTAQGGANLREQESAFYVSGSSTRTIAVDGS